MNRFRTLLVLALVLAAAAVVQLSGAASPPFADIGAGLTAVQSGSVAWGDYNTDGRLDILLTGSATSTSFITKIYKNNGNGSFSEDTTAESGLAGVRSSSVAWGDYNRDGKPDILLTGLSSSGRVSKIYRNNGNGSFSEDTTAGSVLAAVNAGSVAWGDYNRDGRPDIVLTGLGNSGMVAKIYKNNGNGTFSENTLGEGALNRLRNTSVAWGDYNSDGRPDILLTGNTGSTYVSKIYTNNGAGTFSEDTVADSGLAKVSSGSVAWGDYNSDSYPDILLTGYTGKTYVSKIYKNNRNGTFTAVSKAVLTGVRSGSAAWGDYNSDGKLDILLTGSTAKGRVSRIYRNNGNDTFTAVTTGLNAVFNSSAAWGDYNSDGRLDILLTGSKASVRVGKVYRNNGNDTFSAVAATGLPAVSNSSAAWGDFNSDGKLDILLNGYTTTRLARVYRNDTAKWNTVPNAPINLHTSTGPAHVTFSWSGADDSQTAVAALTYNLRVGTTSGGSEVVSPLSRSNGTRLVPQNGNVGERAIFMITGLPAGVYYWSVQTVDTSFAGSAFTGERKFIVPPGGKIVSAKLSKKQLVISQAGKVKLACTFSPKSTVFAYVLKLKKGTRWVVVKKASKIGPFTVYKTTVRKLFAEKKIVRGLYSLKLSGDRNSKTLRFRVA
jgi:hypothetical protein